MEFILPNIAEGVDTISISEICIKENQTVSANDIIMMVETDKATIEIPIDENCTIQKIYVDVGDLISPGQKILNYTKTDNKPILKDIPFIAKEDAINDSKQQDLDMAKDSKVEIIDNISTKTTHIVSTDVKTSSTAYHASPNIRKLARENNIDISKVKGTGLNNRITKNDILNFNNINSNAKPDSEKNDLKSNLSDTLSKWGLVEEIELNKIEKTSAKRLSESWNTIPHVTQFDESDITNLDKLISQLKAVNKNKSTKPSYIPFFIKAVSNILQDLVIFNTSIDNQTIIKKHYFNIGFAVDTPKGLLVPVIKDVNRKSLKSITIEFNKLIIKAKNNKLTLDDMSGGCFTISSLGNIGGKFFTPIINPPEVAILGISKFSIKPIFSKNKFVPRKILPISLSYDHRVINGSSAAKFTKLFTLLINNPSQL